MFWLHRWIVPLLLTCLAVAQERPPIGIRVFTATGEPAAGAVVELRWRIHPELPGLIGRTLGDHGLAQHHATADERGRVRIEAPADGPFELTAIAAAGEHRSPPQFPVMAGDFVDLTLEPPFVVAGTLLDDEGAPLAKATLTTQPNPATWGRLAAYRMPEPRAVATTAADGTFAFVWPAGYLRSPRWEPFVSLQLADGRLLHQENELLRRSERCRNLRLQAKAPNMVAGRVLATGGAPAVGAEIVDLARPWLSRQTDAQGGFVVPTNHPQGLRVRFPGCVVAPAVQDALEPGREQRVQLVASSPPPVRLRRADGTVAAATAVLWVLGSNTEAGDRQVLFEIHAQTDASGDVIPPPERGDETVHGFVRDGGVWLPFVSLRGLEPPPRELAVTPRAMVGTVRGADGTPLPSARVTLRPATVPAEALAFVTYTDRVGRFAFAAVPQGPLRLAAEAGTHGFAWSEIAADAVHADLRVTATGAIAVTVHDTEDLPIAGAWVSLVRVGGEPAWLPGFGGSGACVCALADATGVARFAGLPAGTWTLVANFLRRGEVHAGVGKVETGQETTIVARRSRA